MATSWLVHEDAVLLDVPSELTGGAEMVRCETPERAREISVAMTAHDALVSALEAALADGGLFQATELQVKEALKMARGEG